ncbi:hypothetical protein [Cupriavidus necator]
MMAWGWSDAVRCGFVQGLGIRVPDHGQQVPGTAAAFHRRHAVRGVGSGTLHACPLPVATSHQRAALHFIGATLFVALVAGLSTLVPYLLRQATNALSMDAAHRAAGSAVLLAGAYRLAWTAAHAFEWLKLMLSAAVLARCGAAFHHVIFARLIRVDYTRLSEQDPGKLVVSVIARSRARTRA